MTMTIDTVTELILKQAEAGMGDMTPAMRTCYESVLGLIESKAGGDADIKNLVTKVRSALQIKKPKKEKINAPET